MPRLLRPHIPISVRLEVALRQLRMLRLSVDRDAGETDSAYLPRVLGLLSARLGGPLQLDHDPALENRKKLYSGMAVSLGVTGIREIGVHIGYEPDANDPAHLLYRTKHGHHIKTNVRGDGAQYPDRVLAKRERRRVKKKSKPEWKPTKTKHIQRSKP